MTCSDAAAVTRRIMPPTYFFGALVLAIAARFLAPAWVRGSVWTLVAGALLLAAGVALNLVSDSAFKRHGAPVNPGAAASVLLVSGAFRVTRNPMYLGMVSIVAGAALVAGAPVGLLAALALLWALNRLFVPAEELKLARAFGEEYDTYRSRVPRWI